MRIKWTQKDTLFTLFYRGHNNRFTLEVNGNNTSKMTQFFQLFSRFPVVCFMLITIAHLQNSHIWSTANTVNPVCDTVECKQLGDLYNNNRNSFGRACVNFYDYVCHGWGQQFPRPKNEEKWDVAQMMHVEVLKEIKELLEDKKVSNMEDFEQAKAVYKACMNRPHLENAIPRVLKKAMNSVAEWPMMYPTNEELPLNMSCWALDQLYIKLTGESTLFNFNIVADNFNPKELATELKSLESPYGKIYRVSTWNIRGELPNYVEFVRRIMRKLAPPNYKFPEGTFYNDFRDILSFREALRKIIEETKSEEAVRVPLKMFQTSYAKRSKLHPNTKVNWLHVLRAIHKTPEDPDGLKITEKTTLYVEEDYFVKLAELLSATPKKVIVNHIHLYFLERHIEIDSSLRILLKDSVTVGATASGKIRDEGERWQKCISSNNMEAGIRKMYQKATLPDKKKNAMSVLIDEAKRILKDHIDESNWLDVAGKNAAKYKLEKMWKTIGYAGRLSFAVPDCITANACYLAEKNEIYVANGLMRPPMYVENAPLPVQYGATVSILGHELHHGFDNKGILFDARGIFSPWPNERLAQFHRQTHCFYNHFVEFRQKYFRKLDMCPKRAYATDTLDEDISDAMGLKLAYKGYKQKLKETNGTCQVLPHFENFSCDQLFFIAHANTMCSAFTTTAQEVELLCEDHNIPEIRINGAVANMKEFSDAFKCTSGDPMNMATGCDIWKK